jgi:hypothetical protein
VKRISARKLLYKLKKKEEEAHMQWMNDVVKRAYESIPLEKFLEYNRTLPLSQWSATV